MEVRAAILARVRGPLLAAATVCCAAPGGAVEHAHAPLGAMPRSAVPLSAMRVGAMPVAVATHDPVGYDAGGEIERFAALDQGANRDGDRRERRIREQRLARRADAQASTIQFQTISIHGCGRG